MDENKWMKTTYSMNRNKLDTPALKNLNFFFFTNQEHYIYFFQNDFFLMILLPLIFINHC